MPKQVELIAVQPSTCCIVQGWRYPCLLYAAADSSASQPDAPAAKQQPAARVTSAAGKAAAGPSVQLVNGLAPADVDLKGVPALAPCRVVIDQQVSAAVADAARAKENAIPTAEQKSYRDDTGHYGPEQPFWAKISDARWVLCWVAGIASLQQVSIN